MGRFDRLLHSLETPEGFKTWSRRRIAVILQELSITLQRNYTFRARFAVNGLGGNPGET